MTITKYRAGTAAVFAAPAGTTPFFVMQGSATKMVRIKRIGIDGPTLTAVAYLHIIANKCSTAASGGTPVALTAVPVDSRFDASTIGTINVYTAAPTGGTPVGVVSATRLIGQSTTPAAAGIPHTELFFEFPEPLILRGAAEGISLHFSAAPASAVTLSVTVEWEEE